MENSGSKPYYLACRSWWTKMCWKAFLSGNLDFPLSVWFHQLSTPFYSSVSRAI